MADCQRYACEWRFLFHPGGRTDKAAAPHDPGLRAQREKCCRWSRRDSAAVLSVAPISAEECATRADAHAAPHRQTARRTSIPKSKHFSPLRQSNHSRMLCPVRPSAVSALGGGAPAIVWHQLRGFRANGGACRIALNNSARPALRRSSQIWSHAGLNRGPYGYWPYALTN